MGVYRGDPVHLFHYYSNDNSTTAALSAGSTFTGVWEDTTGLNTVSVAVKTDQSGTCYIEFSPDKTNIDSTLSFAFVAGTAEPPHSFRCMRKFCRVKFTNTAGSAQTYLRLQTGFGPHNLITSALNSTINTDADSIVARSVLYGQNDAGNFHAVPVDGHGHQEVAVHGPLLPFGSVHTENLRPVFQHDFVYQIDSYHHITTTNASGSVTNGNSMAQCSTGTTIYGAGSLTNRKRLRYRPGQGVVARFTAMYTTGVANSYQIAGIGHPEDGLYFGYVGTQFGILYGKNGVREVQTLTITTKSSTAENAVVTLNGTAFNVAVTNGASTVTTAYEISKGTYTGWRAEQLGSTVVFIASSVGNKTGSFSISGTTVIGSFSETKAGVALTETFIPQTEWTHDVMDGSMSDSNPSGVLLDPTKLNVFQIGVQYLGAGAITFQIETAEEGNNPTWVTVHTLALPNTLTSPTFSNPSFQFQLSAYSAGSTTNLTVKSASYAGFIEGQKLLHGNRYSYFAQSTGVGAANYTCLFSVRNSLYYAGKSNQSVINLVSIAGALKHTSPCTIYIFKDATLAGTPNFTQYSSSSSSHVDTAATTATISTNDQIIWSGSLGDTGNFEFAFTDEITIQPGETITIVAKSSTGTPSYVIASLNTREDQ